MSKTNPQIDHYIDKLAPFAQEILNHLRELIHTSCPDVEEKMKWSFPHFDYKGEMMCSMAGFKQHCALNFWKGNLIKTGQELMKGSENHSMGRFGRITSLKDLPSDKILIKMIKEACALNDQGVKQPRVPKTKLPAEVTIPDYIVKALAKNKKAKENFLKFPPSHKREYITWIEGAKAMETRQRRIETMIEWVAEGKGRNWKYEKK